MSSARHINYHRHKTGDLSTPTITILRLGPSYISKILSPRKLISIQKRSFFHKPQNKIHSITLKATISKLGILVFAGNVFNWVEVQLIATVIVISNSTITTLLSPLKKSTLPRFLLCGFKLVIEKHCADNTGYSKDGVNTRSFMHHCKNFPVITRQKNAKLFQKSFSLQEDWVQYSTVKF